MSQFNTITNVSQSPLDAELIYVGTDDGLIQVTENGGKSWRRIDTLPEVPDRFFVNDIKADLHDPDTVYVVVDDHKSGDFSPYVLKSTDRGETWESIAGDLPDRHILWRIVQDHVKPELLFLGTEFGVFFTVNGGGKWTKLKGGAPNIPFRDLAIQARENDLVGATFGRSFYVLDDYTPLRDVTENMLEKDTVLFPVRRTHWYVPKRPLGCAEQGCVGSQGDDFFVAPNPDFGAVFTYYLPETIATQKSARQDAEKDAIAANDDVAFPSWDQIRAEGLEDEPAIILTVRDSEGAIVRHVAGPAEAGFHRVAWDMTYPTLRPWQPVEEGMEPEPLGPGVLVAPGTYTVSMAALTDGVPEDLDQTQSFELVSIREPTLTANTQEQRVIFEAQADELLRAAEGTTLAIDEILAEIAAIKEVLVRSRGEGSFFEIADSIGKRLNQQRDLLANNEMQQSYNDVQVMTVAARAFHARFVPMSSAYGPTPDQRKSLATARETYDGVVAELDSIVGEEYAALKTALDEAKVPWTPGRGIQR
jgi:hypothetical protein